ncbi:MAG: hypothetical protein GY817_06950 [bacterium]|nr:hypothetical protein [bacterium]
MSYLIGFSFLLTFIILLVGIKYIPKENYLRPYFIFFLAVCSLWLLANFMSAYYMSTVFVKLAYAFGGFLYSSYVLFSIKFSLKNKRII